MLVEVNLGKRGLSSLEQVERVNFLKRVSKQHQNCKLSVSSPPWLQGEFYMAFTQLYLGLEESQLSIVQVHILADDGNSHILYEAILRSSPQCGTLAKNTTF
jgi:hypothetical protein